MSDANLDQAYNAPMSTDDAASMLRRIVVRNERPDTACVIKLNNKRVDDWKKNVLDKMTSTRKVPAGRVWESWKLYDEGKNITQLHKLRELGVLPDIPETTIEFWKNLLENSSVEELHAYGSGTIAMEWNIIQTYIKTWFATKKWEELFSQSDDPLFWEKNSHEHSQLLRGEVLPLWDKETFLDINDKVATILNIQVDPNGGFKM